MTEWGFKYHPSSIIHLTNNQIKSWCVRGKVLRKFHYKHSFVLYDFLFDAYTCIVLNPCYRILFNAQTVYNILQLFAVCWMSMQILNQFPLLIHTSFLSPTHNFDVPKNIILMALDFIKQIKSFFRHNFLYSSSALENNKKL